MKTQIFKSRLDFLRREDKSVNGLVRSLHKTPKLGGDEFN